MIIKIGKRVLNNINNKTYTIITIKSPKQVILESLNDNEKLLCCVTQLSDDSNVCLDKRTDFERFVDEEREY